MVESLFTKIKVLIEISGMVHSPNLENINYDELVIWVIQYLTENKLSDDNILHVKRAVDYYFYGKFKEGLTENLKTILYTRDEYDRIDFDKLTSYVINYVKINNSDDYDVQSVLEDIKNQNDKTFYDFYLKHIYNRYFVENLVDKWGHVLHPTEPIIPGSVNTPYILDSVETPYGKPEKIKG